MNSAMNNKLTLTPLVLWFSLLSISLGIVETYFSTESTLYMYIVKKQKFNVHKLNNQNQCMPYVGPEKKIIIIFQSYNLESSVASFLISVYKREGLARECICKIKFFLFSHNVYLISEQNFSTFHINILY